MARSTDACVLDNRPTGKRFDLRARRVMRGAVKGR